VSERARKPSDEDVVPERSGGRWPVAERSVIATVLGVPPLAAVALAAVLTAIGVGVDLVRAGTLGAVFTVCYVVGCVLAVAWVRRSGLFWPMVAPPLLLAVAVPAVVLLAGTPKPGAGVAERLLVIGAPLVNSFPTMAWTTGIVVAVGVVRLVVQRERINPSGPDAVARPAPQRTTINPSGPDAARGVAADGVARPAPQRTTINPSGPDAARGVARKSRSPRRS
jgi:hypothetical protein